MAFFIPHALPRHRARCIPLNPQETLVLYRPQLLRRPARLAFPAQQLMLFALIPTG